MTEHKGLPVAGYVPQSDDKVAVVNRNKILEERVLRQIDAMDKASLDDAVAAGKGRPNLYDPRMIALARTGIQEAFMWLNRAVFQPTRVILPEDNVAKGLFNKTDDWERRRDAERVYPAPSGMSGEDLSGPID